LTINRTGLSLQEASEIDDAFKVVKEALKKMKYVPGVIARYQKDGLSIPEAYLTSTQIQGIEEILGIKF